MAVVVLEIVNANDVKEGGYARGCVFVIYIVLKIVNVVTAVLWIVLVFAADSLIAIPNVVVVDYDTVL